MKLFKATSMEIVQLCQTYLCFELPSGMRQKRTVENFRNKYNEYHYTHSDMQMSYKKAGTYIHTYMHKSPFTIKTRPTVHFSVNAE